MPVLADRLDRRSPESAANRDAMPTADTSGWSSPEQIAGVIRALVETDGFAGGHYPV